MASSATDRSRDGTARDDVPEQADRVDALLARAEAGEVRLTASVLVVAEVLWTLRTFYKRSKSEVRAAVLALYHTPGLTVEDADGLVQAAEWHAEKNVDFADAYHVVRTRALGRIRWRRSTRSTSGASSTSRSQSSDQQSPYIRCS